LTGTILIGDCREQLATLPDRSVHCCVTSPPYWGLRDYGTAEWVGGDPDCDHKQGRNGSGRADGVVDGRAQRNRDGVAALTRQTCGKCGATRVDRQLGLEPTPEAYVEDLVAVFREVWRVLRDDGTLWLNLGSTFASAGGDLSKPRQINTGQAAANASMRPGNRIPPAGYKPKDLVGIPWIVALALQADGWYLRSDIIWSKPNPMPSSVRDRPTCAHEYLFLLAKRDRYYWDQDAVREPHKDISLKRVQSGLKHRHPGDIGVAIPPVDTKRMGERFCPPAGRNIRSVWTIPPDDVPAGVEEYFEWVDGRPFTDVFTIPTQSTPFAHFATFPEALVRPCILAGTSEVGCCPGCGAPWERVVVKDDKGFADRTFRSPHRTDTLGMTNGQGATTLAHIIETRTVGFRPACDCDAGAPVPCTVLDPFMGAGTVGLVAAKLGRDWIGCELNPEYAALAQDRIDHGGDWKQVEQAKAGQARLID